MRNRKLSRGLQVIFTLPHFLSWVTVGGIMTHLLSSSGALNSMLATFGIASVPFLSSGPVFRFLIVFTEIWKESGWTCIIYLAAMAGIDPALYESADLDGANRFQRAMYITIPCIRSTAAILLIMAVGNVMSAGFDQILNLYNPTVIPSADIIDTYIYRITFKQAPNYGLSTAIGLFKGVINCILLLSANFVVGKLDRDSRMI
jgi:putative aldouronate transport system permease protein